MPEPVSPVCSRFHKAVELIGGRWTGAIVRTLLQGKTRYGLIKAAIPDITDRMLSERLRSLETEGLVTRSVVPDSPVRVEYELTEKGRSLEPALNELGEWAERWIPVGAAGMASSGGSQLPRGSEEAKPSERTGGRGRGPRIRAR